MGFVSNYCRGLCGISNGSAGHAYKYCHDRYTARVKNEYDNAARKKSHKNHKNENNK